MIPICSYSIWLGIGVLASVVVLASTAVLAWPLRMHLTYRCPQSARLVHFISTSSRLFPPVPLVERACVLAYLSVAFRG